jgi:hypothetical protein
MVSEFPEAGGLTATRRPAYNEGSSGRRICRAGAAELEALVTQFETDRKELKDLGGRLQRCQALLDVGCQWAADGAGQGARLGHALPAGLGATVLDQCLGQ